MAIDISEFLRLFSLSTNYELPFNVMFDAQNTLQNKYLSPPVFFSQFFDSPKESCLDYTENCDAEIFVKSGFKLEKARITEPFSALINILVNLIPHRKKVDEKVSSSSGAACKQLFEIFKGLGKVKLGPQHCCGISVLLRLLTQWVVAGPEPEKGGGDDLVSTHVGAAESICILLKNVPEQWLELFGHIIECTLLESLSDDGTTVSSARVAVAAIRLIEAAAYLPECDKTTFEIFERYTPLIFCAFCDELCVSVAGLIKAQGVTSSPSSLFAEQEKVEDQVCSFAGHKWTVLAPQIVSQSDVLMTSVLVSTAGAFGQISPLPSRVLRAILAAALVPPWPLLRAPGAVADALSGACGRTAFVVVSCSELAKRLFAALIRSFKPNAREALRGFQSLHSLLDLTAAFAKDLELSNVLVEKVDTSDVKCCDAFDILQCSSVWDILYQSFLSNSFWQRKSLRVDKDHYASFLVEALYVVEAIANSAVEAIIAGHGAPGLKVAEVLCSTQAGFGETVLADWRVPIRADVQVGHWRTLLALGKLFLAGVGSPDSDISARCIAAVAVFYPIVSGYLVAQLPLPFNVRDDSEKELKETQLQTSDVLLQLMPNDSPLVASIQNNREIALKYCPKYTNERQKDRSAASVASISWR